MLGPVLLLKLKGQICPCLESEQDQAARDAASTITDLPIRFYCDNETSSGNQGKSNGGGVGGLVSGLFGKNNAVASLKKAISSGTIGRLTLIDSALQGPSLMFEKYKLESSSDNFDDDDNDNDTSLMERKTLSKMIPLRQIGEVNADDSFLGAKSSGIALNERNLNAADDNDETDGGKELIRFDIRQSLNSTTIADSETRDDILDKIFSLVQWDRRRRTASGDDEQYTADGDDAAENEGEAGVSRGGPKKPNVASKIKHFAQREIELTKQKREREKKKAKYMKESGGLKYTAVAMANREMA